MYFLCSSYYEDYEEMLINARKIPKGDIVAIIATTRGIIFRKTVYNLIFYRWIDKSE